ncbi:aminotransferase class V-fold PLP-dependent enzyme [Streptomyces xiaopingdaonensis]|uniref:aminotransferase class V-fold PLP-dependent enzyme n=1 Tax=Streptomyces xiaopingdaonensis TaxID=1565415 RepID=UPI0002F5022C|nr:aminotransferase class V-fold PLP-dependent enzyme [Streptomyces xiaopingdaonensis]
MPIPTRVQDRSSEEHAPLPVLGDDVHVPLRDGGSVPYAALDVAASAPALRQVWDDVAAFAPYYGSVHRGAGHLSQLSSETYERSRATVAAFLGCRPDDALVLTRSTTDSMNLLAAVLPSGTRVFVFESEHHAALLCWRDRPTTVLPAPRSPAEAVASLERALAEAAEGPRLVCVTGASNVTGEVWPVERLAAVARRHGARTVVDAAQLAPHRRVDVAGWGVDWVALSGHKLYAPFGAGVLAGRADWLEEAEPYLAGGGASSAVERTADGRLDVAWRSGAARHEAGSPNVLGAVALASACTALTEAGRERLAAREERLLDRLRTGLEAVPGVSVLSLFGPEADRVAVVSFTVRGLPAAHVAAELAGRYGIGVRDGFFCAHPLVRTLLEEEGPAGCGDGGGAVRASFGAGTPAEHVERLVRAVGELAR